MKMNKQPKSIYIILSLLLIAPKNHASEINISETVTHSTCNGNSIDISNQKGIHFEGVGGFNQILTIQPNDFGAAIFSIRCGQPYQRFKLKITNEYKFMIPFPFPGNYGDKVKIYDYIFGGSVTRDGYGTLNKYGSLSDIRMGASAKILKNNLYNFYTTKPEIKVEFL